MPCDDVYYYDFSKENKLTKWEILKRDDAGFTLRCSVDVPQETTKLLLSACQGTFLSDASPVVTRIAVNGKWIELAKETQTAYIENSGSRHGCRVHLHSGKNEFIAEGIGRSDDLMPFIRISLAPLPERVTRPQSRSFRFHHNPVKIQYKERPFVTDGFRPGIGTEKNPGRFGFSKGDGLLDFAMPTLGNVDKMYLCGHPRYKKNFRWNYSTLPEGAARHGSYAPANHGIDEDELDVSHLSVKWGTVFSGSKYCCTYSLASPGLITENKSAEIRLGELEFAGNYQYALVPVENDEYEVITLDRLSGICSRMNKNFLLLFGCTEFPDLPLLLVFTRQPKLTAVQYTEENRLSSLRFANTPLLITATPFGFESFDPIDPDNTDFLTRAVDHCLFWSHALLAYPVKCREYFRNDEASGTCTIRQEFSYRIISDEWHTEPLKLAPLPPVVTLCGVMKSEDQEDFHFPTKYGYLCGAYGSVSEYTLPLASAARKFPLKDTRDKEPETLLKKGLESYFRFAGAFPDTEQSYPYAGALMEPYALATTLMNFMSPEDRDKLAAIAKDRLTKACDPERSYRYTVIHHRTLMEAMPDDEHTIQYFRNPELKHRKLWNWYERTEPFTGIKFHVCYLNLCFFSDGLIREGTREEIANLKIPLVENDWGAGLTFYYMYLCALASGDFSPIRDNWKLIRSIFGFFEKMHDWACCGSGYSDNGILWVEGANYGVYTSFVNMAQALGDTESYERGMYIAAKQFALRSSILHASQEYFCKYYGVEPWHITKIYSEESNPTWQHQGVPSSLGRLRFRSDSIYNLTTEGLYPEILDSLRQWHPQEYHDLFGKYRTLLHNDELDVPDTKWQEMQQTSSMLIGMALDPDVTENELKTEIEFVRCKGFLMDKWRGIHIYSRRLPENYLEAQLLAWNRMKEQPLWLEHWQNIRILSAEWNGTEAKLQLEKTNGIPLIRFGIRKEPTEVLLDGKPINYSLKRSILDVATQDGNVLTIRF